MRPIPPTLDMQPDGSFRTVPKGFSLPLRTKFTLGAVIVAVLGLSLTIAALAVWFISMILPVVIIAAGLAWLALRFRRPLFGGKRGGPVRPL